MDEVYNKDLKIIFWNSRSIMKRKEEISSILNQSVTHSVNTLASIFTAECIAIISAVNLALKQTDRNALIFMDSLSVFYL